MVHIRISPAAPAAVGAPILVLLDTPAASAALRHDQPLLGLTLARRAELAARRAGYATTVMLRAGAISGDDVQRAAQGRRIVFAPAQALAEVGWLQAAATAEIPAGGWVGLPGRVAILDPAARLDLATLGEPTDFAALERQLTIRCGPPAHGLDGSDIAVIRAGTDVPLARRRLLRALVKESDGFMARHVERPISIAISRHLAETRVTPNQMTVVSGAIGLAAAPFFLSASPLGQTIGALLFLAHSIVDGCDGELARLKFQESRWGGVLDFWADNVVHVAIFSCMALGWATAADASWPLAVGAAAIAGAAGSAGFVHWRLLRNKSGDGPLFTSVSSGQRAALARVLDGAGRRDFIYLVLVLALLGKSSWFLALAGVGAPVYLLLLLVVAIREGASSPPAGKATGAPPPALET